MDTQQRLTTNLQEFKGHWTLCLHCASCYYPGPFIPHNWHELPPPEWSVPFHKCPSFEYFKFRAYTALGRGILAMLVFDDNSFQITNDLIEIAYTCTSCGICSEICPRFQPLTAIWALREELIRQRGAQLPEPLRKIDANIEGFNNNIFGAKTVPETLKEVPTTGENIYFAGCIARFQEPGIARAAVDVLKATGIDIAYLGGEENCCGFIQGHDGNTHLLEKMATRNIETLKKAGAKRVIVSCAHCYKALKIDYPSIVGSIPFEVVHIAELLAKRIDEKEIKFKSEIRKKITYHDPCFLGRHSKIYDEPRKVLKNIPGIELVEMERNGRWSYCCGSGAKITSICYPEFAAAIANERLKEGKQAADTIVTACTSCFSHMKKEARKEKMELEIYDFSVLVAEAMELNRD
jgi:heterodisulfide reductase subunit D